MCKAGVDGGPGQTGQPESVPSLAGRQAPTSDKERLRRERKAKVLSYICHWQAAVVVLQGLICLEILRYQCPPSVLITQLSLCLHGAIGTVINTAERNRK